MKRTLASILAVCLSIGPATLATGATAAAGPNGGWAPQTVPAAVANGTEGDAISCPTAVDCWAVATHVAEPAGNASGSLIHTTDGGRVWTTQALPGGIATLLGISCISSATCWAVGQSGVAIHTTDGGAVWTTQSVPAGAVTLYAVSCAGPAECWIAGDTSNNQGVILHTDDGGAVWTQQSPPAGLLTGISCSSTQSCWATSNPAGLNLGIIGTNNGGATWYRVGLPVSGTGWLSGISCTGSECVAVGAIGGPVPEGQPLILYSQDGGVSWQLGRTTWSGPGNDLTSVSCAPGTLRCWIAGWNSSNLVGNPYVAAPANPSLLGVAQAWRIQANLSGNGLVAGISCANVNDCWATGQAALNSAWDVQATATASDGIPLAPPGSYDLIAADGGVFTFSSPFHGSLGGVHLNQPIVAAGSDRRTGGYWVVARDGGVFNFDAPYFGSLGHVHLNQPIVGMAPDPVTGGYWLVARDGGVFNFDAPYFGSLGNIRLNQPIVGMAAAPDGKGYWLVARDGGVFEFGSGAGFHGSLGAIHLNQPIVAIAADRSGGGYWLVASDGGVFQFGDAPFVGSLGATPLNRPIVAVAVDDSGRGLWLVASDGGVFPLGNAPFLGSLGGEPLNQPIVAMTSG